MSIEIYWLFPAEETPVDNEVSDDGFRIISLLLLLPAVDLFYSWDDDDVDDDRCCYCFWSIFSLKALWGYISLKLRRYFWLEVIDYFWLLSITSVGEAELINLFNIFLLRRLKGSTLYTPPLLLYMEQLVLAPVFGVVDLVALFLS